MQCTATFVPSPPERVAALMDDLVSFGQRDRLPPVAQAALAHAQLETIHPFADGKGRTGRALIQMIVRRRGSFIGYVHRFRWRWAPGAEIMRLA